MRYEFSYKWLEVGGIVTKKGFKEVKNKDEAEKLAKQMVAVLKLQNGADECLRGYTASIDGVVFLEREV